MDQSVTYAVLDDLTGVEPVADLDTAIDGGSLCLFRTMMSSALPGA
ncbi:MAG: hypothetical protein ACLR1T_09035 [Evtepia gabavorous]